MKLHLSKRNFLDTEYTLEPYGEVVYKTQPNSSWWPNSVKISKQLPKGIPHRLGSGQGGSTDLYDLDDLPTLSARGKKSEEEDLEKDKLGDDDSVKGVDAAEDAAEDRFAHLARIDFHTVHSDIISMGGQDHEASSFFKKGGLGWYGRDRVFTGPDGKEYVWELGISTSKLYLNDGSKTMVANYYTKFWSFRHKPENAYLEIMPNGEHMVDLIMITFLYIEKIRDERERAAQRAGHT
ncbi:hypothetical protein AX16_004167 [Volvariella volvacea WC 439]|nr:hypothetical protein AX16_004167 [Volvariella volvacea WC 439]